VSWRRVLVLVGKEEEEKVDKGVVEGVVEGAEMMREVEAGG
jgi:hypothetical protein